MMCDYICMNCGNREDFEREDSVEERVTIYGTETRYINGEGDIFDYGDFEEDDRDGDGTETIEEGDVICGKCQSSNVVNFDYENVDEYKEELEKLGYEVNDNDEIVTKTTKSRLELLKEELQ